MTKQTTRITIRVAARRAGVSPRTMRRYVRRGLVNEPLTEDDLAQLRCVRRLTRLGINLAGVEAILRMRSRIKELQERLEALEARMSPSSRLPEMPEAWMLISLDKWNEAD
jgi:MerR family transcriptional regulator, heat shock protein HspR